MSARTDLRFSFEMSYLKQHRSHEGLPPRPPRFGRRWGQEHALPLGLLRPRQPLRDALEGALAEPSEPLGLEVLASIAHYTLGLMRYEPTDPYQLHRPAPSPRCLYASELYHVASGEGPLPRGLYRFNPVRHCLEARPVAEGMARWLEEQLAGAAGGWLLSSIMDRIGYLYGPFSARLSLLESGHVLSQLRLVSGALGVETQVVPCFKHPTPSTWLGEGETPLAVIRNRAGAPRPEAEGLPGRAPRCARPWMDTRLYRAMLQRNSGHGPHGILPLPVSLGAEDLSGLVWYAMEEYLGTPGAELLRLQLYLAVLHSEDLEPGVYRWEPHRRVLERIRSGPMGREVAKTLFNSPGFAAHHCPAICVIAADIRGACQAWGEEGYARAMEQTGRVAQRVGLAAAAMGLFARPAVSLDEAATDRLLGLHLARETSLYTVLLGKDRDRGFPLRLAL